MIGRLVTGAIARPLLTIVAAVVIAAAAVAYTATNFAITTDTSRLIAPDVPYRQDEIAFAQAFPQTQGLIVGVVEAETPEATDAAAVRLASALGSRADVFRSVRLPQTSEFLARNGLLLLPLEAVRDRLDALSAQAPLFAALARDPTLFGLSRTLTALLEDGSAAAGAEPLLAALAATVDRTLDGEPQPLSWRAALASDGGSVSTRRIVLAQPVLDFGALEPGATAVDLLRALAADAGLTAANDVSVRLTGPVPLSDDEFATLAENAGLNAALTLLAIAVLLWLALRWARLIAAVLVTLAVGLVATAAAGLALVGELNLISVAFAALFVGLGVDFGIQFAVRYRAERHRNVTVRSAVLGSARGVGFSLTLAAAALLAGFFSFLPTEFRGVSELGLIAGIGMAIAFLASLTLLPALMTVLALPDEPRAVETAALARVDRWIARHRRHVIVATGAVTLAGLPFLLALEFDSNPMNLRSQEVESVATFLDLSRDPATAPNTLQVLVPDVGAVGAMADRLLALSEVDHVTSVLTFLPDDQAEKLALIQAARERIVPALAVAGDGPAATEPETVAALRSAAGALGYAARSTDGAIAATMDTLSAALARLADAPAATQAAAERAVFTNFDVLVQTIGASLSPERITLATLPGDLRADWIAADGRARIEVSPTADANDNAVVQRFADAVRTVAPEASGPPVGITEAGKLIVRAFLEAGLFALAAITVILWIALRNLFHVVLALGPLVLAGIVTLEFASLIGLPLNFANVIALPLMFGVGVAFHIYYLLAWRGGVVDVLASSLTRAIFFSALTTGTAFGSLWASSHPGTASMGQLLAISLVFTLLAAFFVVPAFLGPPPAPTRPPKVARPAKARGSRSREAAAAARPHRSR